MVAAENHEIRELANRLTSAADGIVNQAAVGLERDLRGAAELIRDIDHPVALLPKMMSELAKIANTATDTDTQRRFRRLIGETQ